MNSINRHSPLLQPPPPPAQLREEEVDALAIFRMVRRRIVLMVALTVLITAASLPWILPIQRQYYAESRLMIHAPLAASLTEPEPGGPGVIDLSTEVARLPTRAIAEHLITEFDLLDSDEFNPALRREPAFVRLLAQLRSKPPEAVTTTDPMERALPEFLAALRVERLADVVVIGFTSRDPDLVARIPNAVVQAYLDAREHSIQDRVTAAQQWLAARIADQQVRVVQAEDAVRAFRVANDLMADDSQAEAAQAVASLIEQRNGIETTRADLAPALSDMEAANARGSLTDAAESPLLTSLREDLQNQQRDLAKLMEVFGPDHANVADARARVGATEAAIAREAVRVLQSVRGRVEALDQQEALVSASLVAAQMRLSRTRTLEGKVEFLARSSETEQAALDGLKQQQRRVDAQGALPLAEIEVLSPASVPLAPIGRGRLFYLVGAFVAAASVALATICILELLDRGVRGFRQLEGLADIRPAGLVPRLPRRRRAAIITTLQAREGLFADAVRSVALALQRTGGGPLPASLLVTSAMPGEGKTTLALALAGSLSASGHPVLLVDGDLRHGTLHDLLGVSPGPGLTDFLSGRAELDQLMQPCEPLGFQFIARGYRPASGLDFAGHFDQLFDLARRTGRVLIIDGAPILATTETLPIAGRVERNLLLARWGKTTRRDVELAVNRLRDWTDAEILVALTMVDAQRYPLYGFGDAGLFDPKLRKYYGSSI